MESKESEQEKKVTEIYIFGGKCIKISTFNNLSRQKENLIYLIA